MVTFCSHYYRSKAIGRAKQGGARAMDLPAKSFDLAIPGVAPSLLKDWGRKSRPVESSKI